MKNPEKIPTRSSVRHKLTRAQLAAIVFKLLDRYDQLTIENERLKNALDKIRIMKEIRKYSNGKQQEKN